MLLWKPRVTLPFFPLHGQDEISFSPPPVRCWWRSVSSGGQRRGLAPAGVSQESEALRSTMHYFLQGGTPQYRKTSAVFCSHCPGAGWPRAVLPPWSLCVPPQHTVGAGTPRAAPHGHPGTIRAGRKGVTSLLPLLYQCILQLLEKKIIIIKKI